MATSAEPGRSSASRLFAVLNAFDRAHPAMTLSALSAASGMPIATTYRNVRELMATGAIERNPDGSYQIGLRLWQLGALAPRQRDLRRVARTAMASLHEQTGETVQLAVLDGNRALCVEKLSGTRSAPNVTEVAAALPLHATGVGKVILCFGDPGELPDFAGRRLRRFTMHTITDPGLLDEELDRTRAEYTGFCREELTLGTSSVAAPVFDDQDRLVAALGVLVASRGALGALAPAVRLAALAVSQRLGHRGVDWPARALR